VTSADRVLAILRLFSSDQTVWSAEEVASHLHVSVSQAYRYCKSLIKAGLLDPAPAGFVLGPGFIEYDRLIRNTDPMIRAAHPIMRELIRHTPEGSAVLLARLYHERVMCVDQVVGQGVQAPISFERGRPMPMLKGATSKVILAYIPARALRRIYDRDRRLIASSGLGGTWDEFKAALQQIRRSGFCIARAEVDPGRAATAVPIFGLEEEIVGSLTFVLPHGTGDSVLARLISLGSAAAHEIEAAMRGGSLHGRKAVRRRLARARRSELHADRG
jgi:DNA-binding IclR family transcriptional regulator